MASFVQRARQVVSAEDDDFFRAETILYYINKSKRKVVSFATQQELRGAIRTEEGVIPASGRSLRALDDLRGIEDITPGVGEFTDEGSYWKGNVDFPTDLNQVLNIHYDGIILRELNSQKIYMLNWGNLIPTVYEGYYYITNENGKVFQVYVHEDPANNNVVISYIKNPSEVLMEDETFDDLPEQLENAVIYGAALMMVGQESVKDPEGNVQVIGEIYQNELQNSLF